MYIQYVIKNKLVLKEQIYTSTDITAIFDEIKKVQQILDKIHEMRQGLLGTAIVTIMDEVRAQKLLAL